MACHWIVVNVSMKTKYCKRLDIYHYPMACNKIPTWSYWKSLKGDCAKHLPHIYAVLLQLIYIARKIGKTLWHSNNVFYQKISCYLLAHCLILKLTISAFQKWKWERNPLTFVFTCMIHVRMKPLRMIPMAFLNVNSLYLD